MTRIMVGSIKCELAVLALLVIICQPGERNANNVNAAVTDTWGNKVTDGGNITWVECPVGNKTYVTNTTYDDGGLEMLFAFARSFINTVQPNDFPFGVLTEVINGTFEIGDDYMELVQYSIGFAACFAIGILFVIFLPLCGCCICCCRCCCGNCGGDLKAVYDKNEDCKRMGLAQALFMMVVLMGGAAGCVWVTNGRFTVAIDYTQEKLTSNLVDIETFLANVVDIFVYLSQDMYNLVGRAIMQDIEDLGVVIEALIFDNLKINDVVDAVIQLDATVHNISDALATVTTDKDALVSAANALSTAFNDLVDNIDSTKSTCSASGVACDIACQAFDTDIMATASADFSALPDFAPIQTQIDAVKAMNLSGIAYEAKAGVDDISGLVANSTAEIRTTINTTMGEFAGIINNMTNDLVAQLNGTVNLTEFTSGIDDLFGMISEYDVYRVYFGWGLSGLFSVIVVISLLGICCGCIGQDSEKLPTERSCMSHCGGRLLIIPVVMMFFVGSLLMILTTLTFVVGGNMEKLCQPLLDLSMFKDFVDAGSISGFTLGELLHQNASIGIGFYPLLLGCRANKAVFKLLALDELLPLQEFLNFTKYTSQMQGQMDDMKNIDLSQFAILTPEMKTALTDLQKSGVNDIDFAAINASLDQNPCSVDFAAMISGMKSVRDSCSGAAYSSWNKHISDLSTIRDVKCPAVSASQTTLKSSMAVLAKHLSGLNARINNTLEAAQKADDQMKNNFTGVFAQAIEDFANRVINYIQQFAEKAVDMAYNDVGRCLPLWNLYDSFTTILCSYMVQSLNAFWFGTGWGLLFFIPVMVLCMKLSKYYRRMDSQTGFKEEEEPLDEDIDDFGMRYDLLKKNKVAPNPEYMD